MQEDREKLHVPHTNINSNLKLWHRQKKEHILIPDLKVKSSCIWHPHKKKKKKLILRLLKLKLFGVNEHNQENANRDCKQRLREYTALSENPCLVPSIHVVTYNHLYLQVFMPFSASQTSDKRVVHKHAHRHTPRHIQYK